MFGLLREAIKLQYGTQYAFAEALGISETSLNLKLNGKVDFTATEIKKSIELLDIADAQIYDYFFKCKVK